MSGSDAAVTANGPLMARGARISQPARRVGGTIAPLTRAFAVERVTRIELAWPAWKVALGERLRAISACEKCPEDAADYRLSPCLMARYWPIQPSGLWGKSAEPGGNIGKAAMAQGNHLGPARGDPRHMGVVPLRFRRDLDGPVHARRTCVRLAARRPTDEHRPRA
jgi:hypothetical protein